MLATLAVTAVMLVISLMGAILVWLVIAKLVEMILRL